MVPKLVNSIEKAPHKRHIRDDSYSAKAPYIRNTWDSPYTVKALYSRNVLRWYLNQWTTHRKHHTEEVIEIVPPHRKHHAAESFIILPKLSELYRESTICKHQTLLRQSLFRVNLPPCPFYIHGSIVQQIYLRYIKQYNIIPSIAVETSFSLWDTTHLSCNSVFSFA